MKVENDNNRLKIIICKLYKIEITQLFRLIYLLNI